MTYISERPDFTVTVTSGFISDTQWAVHAVVTHRPQARDLITRRKEIEAEAQVELMIGVARESRRGRHARARSVVVLIEGDSEVSGFFNGLEERYHPPAA